jgi:predicted transcriptional regulator
MTLPEKIIQALTQNPNMNCSEIAAATEGKSAAVKVMLWKMAKAGKIVREKSPIKSARKGPQVEYVYSCTKQPD